MSILGLPRKHPNLRAVLVLLAVMSWVGVAGCGERDSQKEPEDKHSNVQIPGVPPELAAQVGPMQVVITDEPLMASYWHADWKNPTDDRVGTCIFGRDQVNKQIGPYCYDEASVRKLRAVQAVPGRSAFDVLGVVPREADLVKVDTEAGEKIARVHNGVFAIRSEAVLDRFSVRMNGLYRSVDLSEL